MKSLDPLVLEREVDSIALDLNKILDSTLADQASNFRLKTTDSITIVGSGDSYFAGLCIAAAVKHYTGIPCEVQSSLEYCFGAKSNGPLVVVVSSSGNSPDAIRAIKVARNMNACTIALTNNQHGTICDLADEYLIVSLHDKEPSPGVRSFQSSLVAILLIAASIKVDREHNYSDIASDLRQLSHSINEAISSIRDFNKQSSFLRANDRIFMAAGCGPNIGTAKYTAAKLIESTGAIAMAIDFDTWFHVYKHVSSTEVSLIVFWPVQGCTDGVAELVKRAKAIGWRILLIHDARDHRELGIFPDTISIPGAHNSTLTPFLYTLAAPLLASSLAQNIGCRLFPLRGN